MSTNIATAASLDDTAQSPSAPLSGKARYQKVKDVEHAPRGRVQLCVDRVTGEHVAIEYLWRDDEIDKYVEREIMNHGKLIHPHVIQFKEVFLTSQHLAIVMEYAPGGDLVDYMAKRGGRLSEDLARFVYQQILIALEYCHKLAVVDRRIRLENTLIVPLPGQAVPIIKLCDFYQQWPPEREPTTEQTLQELAYLAPEVLTSTKESDYDKLAADVWSSGVMLYTMLVGCYPWARKAIREYDSIRPVMERIQRADYTIRDNLNLSPECKDLIQKILVADPAERITIQQITQHKWFQTNLPPRALSMNDEIHEIPAEAQSEETIRAILEEARHPPPQEHEP